MRLGDGEIFWIFQRILKNLSPLGIVWQIKSQVDSKNHGIWVLLVKLSFWSTKSSIIPWFLPCLWGYRSLAHKKHRLRVELEVRSHTSSTVEDNKNHYCPRSSKSDWSDGYLPPISVLITTLLLQQGPSNWNRRYLIVLLNYKQSELSNYTSDWSLNVLQISVTNRVIIISITKGWQDY